MVNDVADWPWSSYRAMINQAEPLKCLHVDWLLSQFGANRDQARLQYQNFVRTGIGLPPVWGALKNQIFLGDQTFVEKLQSQIQTKQSEMKEIPKVQRRSIGRPLSYYVETFSNTKEGMKQAYETGNYTMQQVEDAFAVHYSTVSRAVNNTKSKND